VSALAGSPTEAGQALRTVQVAEVAEHPDNPRDTLGDLTELAASIKTLGLSTCGSSRWCCLFAAGSFCGDNISHWLGRRYGTRVADRLLSGERGRRSREWADRTLKNMG
jgi:hypothetical protein